MIVTQKFSFMKDNQKLNIQTGIKIDKPAQDVFEAIVDPSKISNYFLSASSGRMEEGRTLTWKFPEMDVNFPVRVDKIRNNKYVSYYWNDFNDGTETHVEITLEPRPNNMTFVSISEKGRDNDDMGLKWLKSNTEGWAGFLYCLKAFLEYGINLRKNAVDPSQLPKQEKEMRV
jgi:uncharacterized protein YndB with AHSA1/START domain